MGGRAHDNQHLADFNIFDTGNLVKVVVLYKRSFRQDDMYDDISIMCYFFAKRYFMGTH